MSNPVRYSARFAESTRGRVVALLRRGEHTVDELAAALGLTDNAVRSHLAALERDGVVRQRGSRSTGGKPAFLYEIAPEVESLFSTAYRPVLVELVQVLAERLPAEAVHDALQEVGRRLAAASPVAPSADLRRRVDAAALVLTQLGGIAEVVETDEGYLLRGTACPLADAVRAHPSTCQAAERMVAELTGTPVIERCDRDGRPRCAFVVAPGSDGS